MSEHNDSRRKFIKAAAYTAPVIMTLKAAPSFARGGSGKPCRHGNNGIGQEKRGFIDGPPPGLARKGPNYDFNDNGRFTRIGRNGARFGGRPSRR